MAPRLLQQKHVLAFLHVVLFLPQVDLRLSTSGRGRKLQQEGAELTSVVVDADFLCKCVKVRNAVRNPK